MKKLNVGIIGYGWVATAHIAAINASGHAQVTAVYSSRSLDPQQLRAAHGVDLRLYINLPEMLASPEIDVVSICSYPYQHAEHAIAAARAGKHLIIEKPLALSWEDCRAMARAADENRVKTCVCFECRFSSQFLVTKAVIDQGLLGAIHYGEIDYYHGIGPWYGQFRWNTRRNAGGSALLTAGCHALDALLLCMGGSVETVMSAATRSRSEVFKPYEYDTTSVTILHFANGAIGKCAAVVDCFQPYYFHTHLVGSEGSLLDDRFHSTRLATNKAQWSRLSMKLLDSGDVSDHPYQTQFDTFFEALQRNEEMPLTGLRDALHTHRVIFAADKAAAEKRPVKIEEIPV